MDVDIFKMAVLYKDLHCVGSAGKLFSKSDVNKNAFQQDAYCPLQWPSWGGGGLPGSVCLGECLSKGDGLPRGCILYPL